MKNDHMFSIEHTYPNNLNFYKEKHERPFFNLQITEIYELIDLFIKLTFKNYNIICFILK